MVDDKGPDNKIIAIHLDDPEYAHYLDVSELSPHRRQELGRFFLDYKILENKAVTIEDMRGRDDAEQEIRDAARLYREKIKPGGGGCPVAEGVKTNDRGKELACGFC